MLQRVCQYTALHCCILWTFSLCLMTGNLLVWWHKLMLYKYYMPCSGYYRTSNYIFLCARCHTRKRHDPRGVLAVHQLVILTEDNQCRIFRFLKTLYKFGLWGNTVLNSTVLNTPSVLFCMALPWMPLLYCSHGTVLNTFIIMFCMKLPLALLLYCSQQDCL